MGKHSSSSRRWLQRQQKDHYVKLARKSDYRSRAVYKLIEIDEKDHLFRPGQVVIDLGAAPGSWSQYVAERVGKTGKVIALDILEMEPIDNVEIIQGDFTTDDVFEQCLECLAGRSADLVISDMAPNLSGIKATDQARSIYLAELALDLSRRVLNKDGALLVKMFQGEGADSYRTELKEHFKRILTRKPRASREGSREFYLLAHGLRH